MKFLRAITAQYLPMVRQVQAKHTQWKEAPEKRFKFHYICQQGLSLMLFIGLILFDAFCRMVNFQMMLVLYQELFGKSLIY